MKIDIRKRPWIARLIRVPITALRHYRITGNPLLAIRLALIILK